MAKVIKHFEGSGTGTPYTVPSGKIAKIEGSFSFMETNNDGAFKTPWVKFSNTQILTELRYYGGVHLLVSPDTSIFSPFAGTSSSLTSRTIAYRMNESSTSTSYAIAFLNGVIPTLQTGYYTATSGAAAPITQLPAPRIYISAGDTVSFSQPSGSYVGYSFIAIEEDA